MIFDPTEYTRHKETTEDISYRKATEEETERFRRLENVRAGVSGPASIIFIAFSVCLLIYFIKNDGFNDIFVYAAGLFVILSVVNTVKLFFNTHKHCYT